MPVIEAEPNLVADRAVYFSVNVRTQLISLYLQLATGWRLDKVGFACFLRHLLFATVITQMQVIEFSFSLHKFPTRGWAFNI